MTKSSSELQCLSRKSNVKFVSAKGESHLLQPHTLLKIGRNMYWERTSMACHSSLTLSLPSLVSSYGKPWIARCGAHNKGPDACQLCAKTVPATSAALFPHKFRTWNNQIKSMGLLIDGIWRGTWVGDDNTSTAHIATSNNTVNASMSLPDSLKRLASQLRSPCDRVTMSLSHANSTRSK